MGPKGGLIGTAALTAGCRATFAGPDLSTVHLLVTPQDPGADQPAPIADVTSSMLRLLKLLGETSAVQLGMGLVGLAERCATGPSTNLVSGEARREA